MVLLPPRLVHRLESSLSTPYLDSLIREAIEYELWATEYVIGLALLNSPPSLVTMIFSSARHRGALYHASDL